MLLDLAEQTITDLLRTDAGGVVLVSCVENIPSPQSCVSSSTDYEVKDVLFSATARRPFPLDKPSGDRYQNDNRHWWRMQGLSQWTVLREIIAQELRLKTSAVISLNVVSSDSFRMGYMRIAGSADVSVSLPRSISGRRP